MSIYKKVLGQQFYNLHPKLQERYLFSKGRTFIGTGVMKTIKGGPRWLFPFFWLGVRWKLLFPEHRKSIPFKIVNTARIGKNGEEQIHWERTFYFDSKKRYFNALMSFDDSRSIIKDYLREPPIVYSDLSFSTQEGYLQIKSEKQRLVLGKVEIPLPTFLQGLATVTEMYNEKKEVFCIKVTVTNSIIGTIFSYEGEFTQDDTI